MTEKSRRRAESWRLFPRRRDEPVGADPERRKSAWRLGTGSGADRHAAFALFLALSVILFWEPLRALENLAFHSDYYTHTVLIPLLAGYLIYRGRKRIFAGSRASLRLGLPLLLAATLLFSLAEWGRVAAPGQPGLAIFSLVLFWAGGFALCYGLRAFETARFPLLLLLLMVPLPMAAMDRFMEVTRVGSAEVASAIFSVSGVPYLREGFLFVLPGVSIEIAKECSGIHSTVALFVLTLTCGYLFLRSPWKKVLLLLAVFPIVSLTNGLRIATLTLLAEFVDRNIFNTSLHRNGGILFFFVAFGLILLLLRFVARWRAGKTIEPVNVVPPGSVSPVSGR
jgi:exosortase